MSSANVIVDGALKLLGATSVIKPAHPETVNETFKILVRWLNDIQNRNITITGLTIPTVIGDDLGEPADATDPIMFNLAVRAAPFIQKIAPPEVKGLARKGFQDIYNSYGPAPSEKRKDTLPLGAGNTDRIWDNRNFYPEGYDKDA